MYLRKYTRRWNEDALGLRKFCKKWNEYMIIHCVGYTSREVGVNVRDIKLLHWYGIQNLYFPRNTLSAYYPLGKMCKWKNWEVNKFSNEQCSKFPLAVFGHRWFAAALTIGVSVLLRMRIEVGQLLDQKVSWDVDCTVMAPHLAVTAAATNQLGFYHIRFGETFRQFQCSASSRSSLVHC